MDVSTQSLAVLTRSGKNIDNGNQATCVDLETQKQGVRVESEKMVEQVQATPVNVNETQKGVPESSPTLPVEVEAEIFNPLPKVHPPFPQRLKKKK